jgi:hypothetical protein
MITHLTDEELILLDFAEIGGAEKARVEAHLGACAECQLTQRQLRRVLTLVETTPPVAARPGFERDVWARLEPQLDGNRNRWLQIFWLPQWALGAGVAALVLAAFVAGRVTGGDPAAPVPTGTAAANRSTERVLHAAVGDHLDRTQMMLAELVNADAGEADVLAGEQARASDLVSANRLIRHSATRSGDADIADVLEDLERVLLEIANAPADATSNQLSDLQSRITTEDLLFRVRVIASEMRERNRPDRETGERPAPRLPTS